MDELRSFGVREVQWLKKTSGWETGPSPTLLLTFAGELLYEVSVGCLSIRVRPHVQDTLRCYKCLRFGHTQARCSRGRAVYRPLLDGGSARRGFDPRAGQICYGSFL